jgi:hypothetical protein
MKVAMFVDVVAKFKMSNGARTWRVWAGSRAAAILVGALLVLALFAMTPPVLPPEPPPIQSVAVASLDQAPTPIMPPPDPVKALTPPPLPQLQQNQAVVSKQSQTAQPITPPKLSTPQALKAVISQRPLVLDRPTPNTGVTPSKSSSGTQASVPSSTAPRIASAPTARGTPSPSDAVTAGAAGPTGSATSKQLRAGTLALLRARECARLDVRDRPADCPPNEELKRLLAQERGPQYRPENAEAFSRNEQQWRGIPPPCLEDGKNFSASATGACIRFGNVPSRVRTVQEICEARGLGGCAPTPNQAAVNAAVAQVKQQEAAKSKKAP